MQGLIKMLATGALASVVLAGCGHTNPAAKRSLQRPAPTTATGGGWMAEAGNGVAPGAADPAMVQRAARILANVDAATKGVRNWTATVTSEVIAPDGEKSWNTSRIVFKHPAVMAATVLRSKDGRTERTKLVYEGGDDVRLKTYFFGFLAIKITLPVSDSRLVDHYKRTMKQTQTKQLFDVILHPQAQAVWIGEGTAVGEEVDFIEVRSPASWKGISREVVGISRRLTLPIYRDCYDMAGKRQVHLELKGMRTNIKTEPNDFTLD